MKIQESFRRMRNVFFLTFAVFLMLFVAGCASLQKKFIREQKKEPVRPVVFTQEKYVKPYSNTYYYKTHFDSWRNWQDELISNLGGNAKREERSAMEALSHLEEMTQYLKSPRKEELQKEIEYFKSNITVLKTTASSNQRLNLRTRFEKTRRTVSSGFYFDKVKESIIPDEI